MNLKKHLLSLLAFPVLVLNANAQTPTAANIKVNVLVAKTSNHHDYLVYSPSRPLRIEDFAGPEISNSIEQAITASGLAMSYNERVENGQTVCDITVEPFFQKSKSWFLRSKIDAEVLSHEQKHFDLTAIKAHELAEALKKASFTGQNYRTLSKQIYSKYMAELDNEERAYDDETHHGNKKGKQNAWDKRINDRLSTIGTYYNS